MSIIARLRRLTGLEHTAALAGAVGGEVRCADCPIVMGCGLEPREGCLPRAEAIASGRRSPRQARDPHYTLPVM